jgi:hypothetical protein
MVIFYIIISLLFLEAGYLGYQRTLRLDHLNHNRVVNALIVLAIVLALMGLVRWLGFLTQSLASKIITGAYSVAAGFFLGYGGQLLMLRKKNGALEYMYRSFWSEIAPNIIFIALFVFGLFRTGLFRFTFFTAIGVTSGCSLMAFSFLGWTVRIVPEFRRKGILILDQFIEWKKVIAYRWIGEEILQIDYYTKSKEIREFKTFIPSQDELIIERLLGNKLREYEEERTNLLLEIEGAQKFALKNE